MGNQKIIALILLFIMGENYVHNFLNIPFLIEDILRRYRHENMKTDETYFKQKPLLGEYDFIVVGAGPGGAVVANRLSENPDWNVLLVEAGKEESILVDIPIFVSYMQFTDFNWGFQTEPQPGACLGLDQQRCRWPRGKGLGGTSSINYMIYTRGNKPDYDMWAEQGNVGWSYEDVLPYFLKSENNMIPEHENSPHHRRGGYLPVEHLRYRTDLGNAFLEAGKEMGYNIIDYNNGEPPLGFAPVQENMRFGHRASSSRAYLRPIKKRDNLHISTRSRVTQVIINPLTKSAEGIQVVRNRRTYTVKARKEVILSAGSLGSPQLLMLSGVGPRQHLEELGIPVIQDLPVGENLQEHVSYCGLTFLVNQSYTGVLLSRLTKPHLLAEFMENGTGPYVLPGAVEALGYINTKLNDDKRGRPDMELIFASGSLTADFGQTLGRGIGVKESIYKETFRPVEGRDSWTVWPMILHPKSRGYLKLKDKNPWHWPKFYANYFQHEQDLDTIVEGIKFTIEMSKTNAFQKYGSYLNLIPLKDCAKHSQGSDDYWRCAVRHLTTTLHHQSGTCKMGPASDPSAVVSPQLKVHGINNLRVIDSSIIPQLITAHTTAPTYMIGEKGSDMIKKDWKINNNSYEPPATVSGSAMTVLVPIPGNMPQIVPVPNPGYQPQPIPLPGNQPQPVAGPNPGYQPQPIPLPGNHPQPVPVPVPVPSPEENTINHHKNYEFSNGYSNFIN